MSMIEPVAGADIDTLARFDAIIDVRSPAEFAEDHLPGAVNLPVLSNVERAEVGAIYKQISKTRARRIGAAHVARNIAGHLERWFADKPQAFYPLVYCWRGGMRSQSMASVLSQVCWRTGVLDGGYKTWRGRVVAELHDNPEPLNIILLDGQTGTAKSAIVRHLIARGAQAIDLEALAAHRGSVFGALGDNGQPPQKLFESRLWAELGRFDLSKPIILEAESNRIGRCEIPNRLWFAMKAARRITVEAPPQIRATYLTGAYADMIADRDRIIDNLGRLQPFHSKETINDWRALARAGDDEALAAALMSRHYDPLYSRSRKRRTDAPLLSLTLNALDEKETVAAADRIITALGAG